MKAIWQTQDHGRRVARAVAILALVWGGFGSGLCTAADGERKAPDAAALAAREQAVVAQFNELEKTFLRLADLLSASDPRRSALLRSVFEQAREQEVGDRLDLIVQLLERGQLLKAGAGQATALEKLRALLDLLESGDSDRQLANTKQQVKQFLARLSKAIARQRDIEGSTEAGADADKLAQRQESLADETETLAREIDGFAQRMDARDNGGKPSGDSPSQEQGSESQPSAGESDGDAGKKESDDAGKKESDDADDEASRARRTKRRLDAAKDRMRKAGEQLDDAKRRDARAEQEKAIEELETARAELEEILRQMREEEVERLLVQLEARLRAMLRSEKAVFAAVEKLAAQSVPLAREGQLEAARLSREQAGIGNEASKALVLIRDDGSAVAIPEALEQMRDDSTQATARLARGDVGGTTRGILQDMIANLEEMLGALEKAQREQQARQQQGQSGGRPADPGEQPLVDKLSELKMIRALQMRVNTRTKRFSQLLVEGVERAEEPELVEALARLAERQQKIERAARDIVTGRTE
jgi:hypothetical protein